MSGKNYLPHTNSALAVVTFEKVDNEIDVATTVHHVIGWSISESTPPVPIVADMSIRGIKTKNYHMFFLPNNLVLDYPNKGMTTELDTAIKMEKEKLILADKKEKPKASYNH